MRFLVTGSAGFIGYHLSLHLLKRGHQVVGVDSLNSYYDPLIKNKRNNILKHYSNYLFSKLDITNNKALDRLVRYQKPKIIIHLAAQAGVRYSLINPWVYEETNIKGMLSVLEVARKYNIKKLIFASSSSVYGGNKKMPFSENDITDNPLSLYAATKKSCELLASSYYNMYGLESVGLRFFTVYGEFARPDMALFKFAKNIARKKTIYVYNNGKMSRNFTFVSDIVDGIMAVINGHNKGCKIYNLGNNNQVKLNYVISLLEHGLDQRASKKYLPMQIGDIKEARADIKKAKHDFGFSPKVNIEEGITLFLKWFKNDKDWLLNLQDGK